MEIHKFHTYKEKHTGLNLWEQKAVTQNKQENNRSKQYYLSRSLQSSSLFLNLEAILKVPTLSCSICIW